MTYSIEKQLYRMQLVSFSNGSNCYPHAQKFCTETNFKEMISLCKEQKMITANTLEKSSRGHGFYTVESMNPVGSAFFTFKRSPVRDGEISSNVASLVGTCHLIDDSDFDKFTNLAINASLKPNTLPHMVLGRDSTFRRFDIKFVERTERIPLKRI